MPPTRVYRSGKSFAAQAWTLRHLGQARYVSLSSATDERSFFVSIAHSLGVARATSLKTPEIRERIGEVFRQQSLLMVFDECQYLLAQTDRPRGAPERVNFLMTAAVNWGVPVALIAGKKFSRALGITERMCAAFGPEQFRGRIRLHKKLPQILEKADLLAIGRVLMPDADEATLLLATGNAIRSRGYLGALETVAARSNFFAQRAGRRIVFDDVEDAISESFGEVHEDSSLGNPPPKGGKRISPAPHRLRETLAAVTRQSRGMLARAIAGRKTKIARPSEKCSELGQEVHIQESWPRKVGQSENHFARLQRIDFVKNGQ